MVMPQHVTKVLLCLATLIRDMEFTSLVDVDGLLIAPNRTKNPSGLDA